MEPLEYLRALYPKLVNGSLTTDELAWLENYFNTGEPEVLYELIRAELSLTDEVAPAANQQEQTVLDQVFGRVLSGIHKMASAQPRRLWPRYAAAASIILALSVGGYFLLHKHTSLQTAQNRQHDLSPGTNKAILKTGYGQTFVLNTVQNGTLQKQGNLAINKISAAQLTYNAVGISQNPEQQIVYDTLTNPCGGANYNLKLADGTRILLNAATIIRYPENFTGNQRQVELISGEAYIEVVHNAQMPFRLITHNLVVNDIGTHFNISAYDDDNSMRATLTEGSIRVTRNGASVLLKPGQEMVTAYHNGAMTVKPADMEETLAWTNGLFHFDHTDLQTVMRQLSRWYNVQVVYEGQVPNYAINGEIYRNLKASQLFEGLNYSKVKFRIEGNKIIVSNK